MKKLIISIFLLSVVSIRVSVSQEIAPGSLEYLDHRNGFKFIQLGDSITTYKDSLTLVGEARGLVFYDVSAKQSIGDSELVNTSVVTYNGLVWTIILEIADDDRYRIFDTFKEAFGALPEKPNVFIDRYVWSGEKVRLRLDIDRLDGKKTAAFISIDIDKMKRKNEEDGAKKSVRDL